MNERQTTSFGSQPSPRAGKVVDFVRRNGWIIPLASVVLMAGIALHQQASHRPGDWEAYHERVRVAVGQIPTSFEGETGHWIGTEIPLPEPARMLLRPNALRHIRFVNYAADAATGIDRVSLLIVQCRTSSDMAGHYPPECYPAHGSLLIEARPRTWRLADAGSPGGFLEAEGVEYHFHDPAPGVRPMTPPDPGVKPVASRIVYNLLVIPGSSGRLGEFVQGMKEIDRSSEDYRERPRGAAQVQVVFEPAGATSSGDLDRVFVEMMGRKIGALRLILGDSDATSPDAGADRGPMNQRTGTRSSERPS